MSWSASCPLADNLLSFGLFGILSNKNITEGLPCGAVFKNPPANAGDMGSSPGPGRSHMLRSN